VSEKRLRISLPACRVGALSQDGTGRVHWRPEEAWEKSGQRPGLGLHFQRQPGPRAALNELPCWFENLLPERETPLRERFARAYNLREGQSYALLGALGRDLIGAVEAHRDDPDAVAEVGAVEEPSKETDPQGGHFRMSALTGVQLKFSMSMVNDRLVLAARSGHSQWIVKIEGRDYEGLAEVEHTTMQWARLAGLPVPDCVVVAFDRLAGLPEGWVEGRPPALAVRRFDRRDDGSKIHQEDLCQALDVRPSNKYGDGAPRVAFEGALKLVTDACGEAAGRDMARRLGFMLASGNSDAHLKNWSLVWGDAMRPSLAPCYDLVATVTWDKRLGWGRSGGPDLALSFAGERSFARIDEAALAAFGARTHAWAAEEVREGIRRAFDAWPAVVETAPLAMRAAIETHTQNVPLLARMGSRTAARGG
jgi:serine/threonine-protein kinase HipA